MTKEFDYCDECRKKIPIEEYIKNVCYCNDCVKGDTMTTREQLNDITNSHINRQLKQMVSQIDEYNSLYDIWEDLNELNGSEQTMKMVIAYHRIKYR